MAFHTILSFEHDDPLASVRFWQAGAFDLVSSDVPLSFDFEQNNPAAHVGKSSSRAA
jgi:hypothetical protein